MTYATLMVHLELGCSNAAVLRAALELAERFDSEVIGIAGAQPMQMYYADGYSGDIIEQEVQGIDDGLKAAESEFRSALSLKVAHLGWRAMTGNEPVSTVLARESRAADLFLTCVAHGDVLDASRSVNTGDLVLQLGRPALVVPVVARELRLEQILVAWNDTRESRRAIADALPLLKLATHVTLSTIAAPDDLSRARTRLADVAHWLERHGVSATAVTLPTLGEDADALWALAQDIGADLIVAGAYGHSRLREWVLGGVTKNLLLSENRYSFVSH